VAALGALALWGWAVGLPRLRDFGADFAPMAPAAALAFLLLAGAYLAIERGGPKARQVAWTSCAVVAVLALLGLVEELGEMRLGMNFEWLLGARSGEIPGHMSPATCVTLLALAVATPLRREQRVFGLSANAVAGSFIGAVGFFVLLGLTLRLLRFDIAAPLLGFSAPSAVATLLCAFALGAGRPSDWLIDTLTSRRTGAVVMRWLLPAALVVPLVVGWTRLAAERAGLFGEAFGMALFTLVMIASLGALILWVAQTLDDIAAQRELAEGEATEQREWLQVTIAAIGDGVIATDAAGQVRFLNPAAQRLTGWRAAEAAGRSIDELLQIFDERDGAAIPNPLYTALQQRATAVVPGEPALRARDNRVHPVQINAAPIVDPGSGTGIIGAVLVLREASAQRRAERAMREAYTELDQRVVRRTAALERASAALRERNALLNAITTSTPDLISAKDRLGRTLMANPAWRSAVGRVEEPQALDDNERLVLESGETLIIEEGIGERTFLITKSPLRDEQARVIGLIAVATDISERKHAQQELEKLVVAEQRLRAEAERANRAKDEFLAIVSHELRSPLNALKGWSHLMLTTQPPDRSLVERAAKAIKRNVDHQTRLIDDLLDTSRIVSGKLTIERRSVNLVEIVLAALDAVRPGAAAKHIDLRFTPDDTGISVVGDAGRLQQLASNLLSNAVKFTPERGSIAVLLLKNGERVQLQVRDNGIGIAPEFLPHVFDRFSQADTSAARRAGGLGIGLALVRHIALLHGGQVRADSQGVGRGATFTVELPALAVAAAPIAEPAGPRATIGTLGGAKVWMVDDDADVHEVVALTLEQAGASVTGFLSCKEAVAALEKALPSSPPDLFLIDLAMPDEDGFQTLRRVRALEMASGLELPVPAVALTAFTQIERERLIAAGFRERVNKPVDAEKLIAVLRGILRERRQAATS